MHSCVVQKEALAELQRRIADLDTELKELRKVHSQQQQQGNSFKRAEGSHHAIMEALQTKRADVLEAAQMEQVCTYGEGMLVFMYAAGPGRQPKLLRKAC